MSNCAVCHKPVKSGIVVHSECMELLQKTQQVENKPMEWISVNYRSPNNEELKRSECFEFLCRVLIPEKGGNVCKKTLVIKYDILDKQWVCDGMIVTHWMPMPAPPEVDK